MVLALDGNLGANEGDESIENPELPTAEQLGMRPRWSKMQPFALPHHVVGDG